MLRHQASADEVSMSYNWKRAIARARGEWIMVIGDDGMLPEALERLLPIRQYETETPSVKRSRQVLRELFSFRRHYAYLPMIYNSFVHRSLPAPLTPGQDVAAAAALASTTLPAYGATR